MGGYDSTNFRCWCIIICCVVGSFLVLALGFFVATNISLDIGLPLVLLGVLLVVLSSFAACGKFFIFNKDREDGMSELVEDAPPSYRISWRQSFLNQNTSSNPAGGRVQNVYHPGGMSYGPGNQSQILHGYTNVGYNLNSPVAPSSDHNIHNEVFSFPFNSGPTNSSNGETTTTNEYSVNPLVPHPTASRDAQLSSGVPDLPPSYEAAMATM